METFTKLFARFLAFVYHCFDRIHPGVYAPNRPNRQSVRSNQCFLMGNLQPHFYPTLWLPPCAVSLQIGANRSERFLVLSIIKRLIVRQKSLLEIIEPSIERGERHGKSV